MSYPSDRMLRYVIRVLPALAAVVFVLAIFMPVKDLVKPSIITSPKAEPTRSDSPAIKNFKRYEILTIDNPIVIGDV